MCTRLHPFDICKIICSFFLKQGHTEHAGKASCKSGHDCEGETACIQKACSNSLSCGLDIVNHVYDKSLFMWPVRATIHFVYCWCKSCLVWYLAGAIQRFSLGFRGPLCLVCGFTGVPPARFALGAAVGALGTMPLQLTVVCHVVMMHWPC